MQQEVGKKERSSATHTHTHSPSTSLAEEKQPKQQNSRHGTQDGTDRTRAWLNIGHQDRTRLGDTHHHDPYPLEPSGV